MAKDIIIEDEPSFVSERRKRKSAPVAKTMGFGSLLDFSKKATNLTESDKRSSGIPPLDLTKFRYITATELIEKGDEYWQSKEKQWLLTSFTGKTAKEIARFDGAHMIYRRPLNQKPVYESPVGECIEKACEVAID